MHERRPPARISSPSEQKFRGLLESAPDAIVIVDDQGVIQLVNGEAERLFGYERDEMIGQAVELLVPDSVTQPHVAHRRSYTEDPTRRPMGIGLDLSARHKDGSEIPVEISLSPLQTDEGLLITSAIRDISARRQAQLALRESERRFREFVEGTDDLVARVDAEGRFLYVNDTSRRVFGLEPADCVGLALNDFVHPDDRERTEKSFAQWIHDRVASATIENRQLSRHGRITNLLWTVNPRYDLKGEVTSITSIARDITDRKRLEAAERKAIEADLQLQSEKMESQLRREILRRSITAQEEERRRIARELHDETAQALTGLSLGLGRIEQTNDVEAARAEAKRLGGQVVDAMRELRRIAMRLRPSTLDDLGLIPALEQLVATSLVSAEAEVTFHHHAMDRRLDPELETIVYRIMQEALTNAARHANASRIRVEVAAEDDDTVVASVQDDGQGLDPEAAIGRGLGLGGMRERAGLANGTLEISSAPGEGTTVLLRAPLDPAST